jgi:ubiquinone/menaquinone biosynthesis C-methylase UbiE
MGQTGTVKRTFLERVRDRLLGRTGGIPGGNDRNLEFWEQAALKDPYAAICTGWDPEKFDNAKESVVFSFDMGLTREMTVLDLGCGLGRVAKFLAPQVGKYVGADFSENMIRLARIRNAALPNVEFHVTDGRTLQSLADGTFDFVFCELAFQHMEKDVSESYVSEVHRVLKTDGVFLAQVPRFEFYKDVFAFTRDETENLFARFSQTTFLKNPNWKDDVPDAYYYIKATR